MTKVVRFADCPPVPWKNGAGTTRELWAKRDPAGETLIRISVAEIRGTQGFSSFPGIDRVILQLDGPPMVLTVDGTRHPLSPRTPLAFAGEAAVDCEADESTPAHDLNLMCRRGSYAPSMELIRIASGAMASLGVKGGITGLLALAPCTLTLPFAASLEAYDLLIAEGAFDLRSENAGDFIRLQAREA